MSSDGLEQIMNSIRIGDKKSNLLDINISDYLPNEGSNRVALLLEKSSNISNKIYRVNFDPTEEIILKKLLHNEFLEKRVVIEDVDFFRGAITLNYYCKMFSKNYAILDDLYDFAKHIEQMDRKLDPKIKDVVAYILKDSFKKNILLTDRDVNYYRSTYNSFKENIDLSKNMLYKPNPLYLETSKRITNEIKNIPEYVKEIDNRADLMSVIFTDTLYGFLIDDDEKRIVKESLDKKEFLTASIRALQLVSREYYHNYIEQKLRSTT